MKVIRGKKALVTGAAGGIGRAIALALAREGADLFLTDINEIGLARTAEETRHLGAHVTTFVCDLSEPDRIHDMVSALLSTWAQLDILINNAGVTYYGFMQDMTDQEWDRLLSINLLAPIQLVRELLPALVAREEAHIVNVCSIVGLVPSRKLTAYQTSKFGLLGFTEGVRAEYGRTGLGITALCPGPVDTGMLEAVERSCPERRRMRPPAWMCSSPDAVAAKAIAAIRNNKSFELVTATMRAAWWLGRISPTFAGWLAREGWRGKLQPAGRPAPQEHGSAGPPTEIENAGYSKPAWPNSSR